MIGFLVIDKPAGCTSHDVVAAVRRATGIKKAGHAGTLDPMATGVVVVALGRATRLIRFVQDHDKEYLATARFGELTDTLDADGAVLEREPMDVTLADIRSVATRFVGTIMQVPPMVSALRVGGRRLYELAREGTEVERAARPVVVTELEIIDAGPPPYPDVRMRVKCGKGTYIRSLADDLASALGGRAHLTSLRRTAAGPFTVDDAVSLDELPEGWRGAVVSPADTLSDMSRFEVDEAGASAVRHGTVFARAPIDGVGEGDHFIVCGPDGSLLAVYTVTGKGAKPEVVIA
ncbi:MAG: tRNA pseudouridine(55) synthase TruB [Acidimicrobiia bacterium]|nr:tRNA pseudouridine(55) synthase TruB [Acidimicrobiia bacterium]MDH4306818.1 tRNA pseudouridine(55) synthase TruB [Acidimicrobiia bacterium]MDH5293990.1 tRNA pseudouridine(55) synthase TruB [Acidimicrobiia bacterium]